MRRKKRSAPLQQEQKSRTAHYSALKNSLTPQPAFSQDRLEHIHRTALRVLDELGIRVLNAEARYRFKAAGARVEDSSGMVYLDTALVEQLLATAPGEFVLHGASPDTDVRLGGDNVVFCPVIGPPYVADLDHGRRAGTLEDTRNFIRLSEHFDVIHVQSTNVESQDIPTQNRHLKTIESQLTLSRKPPFIYSRGTPQVRDTLEMVRMARGLSEVQFRERAYCYTSINTNSPRQLDIPMCQGIIDFAEAGQMLIITPFTLAGAMAPVTIPGALVLQHAEALAGIALAQIVRPGTPVVYGSFTSNVHMKSGSPAFGTPEFVTAAAGAGQLARHVGLPWRGSAATASNAPDEQSVYETAMSAWGTLLGGANFMMHSAGWLEGGLTASLEKFILDIEVLQMFAEIFQRPQTSEDDLAFDAIASVEPGGHFFGCDHTMARYRDAFYEPLVSDWSNFGSWTENGGKTATERANGIWKSVLNEFEPPPIDTAIVDELQDFVARRIAEGGAPPES
ncbi:MAG: trimethylamine methyltransferase family protein [Thiolinea sp.]